MTIEPHGGRLIDRVVHGAAKVELLDRAAKKLQRLKLTPQEVYDIELIATGAFSPLEGFMCKADYDSVVDTMRLENGVVWSLPVVLAAGNKEADNLKEGEDIALEDGSGTVLAVLHLQEKFHYDKEKEALEVYGTKDDKHPGVNRLYNSGDVLLGGKVSVVNRPKHNDFIKYRLDPADTRELFHKKGWRRVVGFQTRNPVHRAHEYIQKCALEIVDGILIHPLVGETKSDDIPAEVRMKCYKALIEGYYPKDRVALVVNPAAMRYAGPKEAVFHALIRKNYGCTHFIIGRDHAGVGNYYGTFDAHYIFENFDPLAIGITPLFFDYTFFCKSCGGMASYKTCPHESANHIILSGTKVREMLRSGVCPPPEFSRPEVAKILIEAMQGQAQ